MNAGPARVLIIAGSDPSGGAGIQADIKTATALGCYALTAITAITVQNTRGIRSIHRLPPAVVREQLVACLDDIGADAIKLGMLGGEEVIHEVASVLGGIEPRLPIVLDPVLAATDGAPLTTGPGIQALKRRLMPLVALVCPNIPEAERLLGLEGKNCSVSELGKDMLSLGAPAALIKGGHGSGDTVEDWLFLASGENERFVSPRLATKHTHGTGCTLSTAITCGLGQGLTLSASIRRAHDYVHEAIRTAPGFGAGRGPLNHMHGKVR